MAFQLNDTTYSGKYSSYMITKAMFSMDTIEKNLCYVKGDIAKLYTIKRMDYTNPLRPREATPTPGGNSYTIDGKQIIPADVMLYEEFNPRDLESTEYSEQLTPRLLEREVPQTIESQMMQLTLNRVAEQYETALWMGSTLYQGSPNVPSTDSRYQLQFFDGWMKRFVADASINLSSISPVTITASNVVTIIDDLLVQAATKKKALVTRKNAFTRMKYLMSAVTWQLYLQAISTGTSFKGIDYAVGQAENWKGYTIERVAGMPDNTILFVEATSDTGSNPWAGMNSQSDWTMQLAKLQANSELYFIKGLWKWDVNYGWSDEIFMYTTLTTSDFTP